VTIDQVFADGVLVAENGKMCVEFSKYSYPEWALNSVHLKPITVKDFHIPAEKPEKVRVMRLFPGKVHTVEEVHSISPVEGSLPADPTRDLAKVAVFYRHEPKEGLTGTKGLGFVTGLNFKANVAYASTVSHDCHNLLVVGTDDRAMATAANELIKVGGGIVLVVDGKVDSILPMPLGGLMSLESVEKTAKMLCVIEESFKKAGCSYDSIEMTLSLLGLIVLEELHLSNKGYVELKPGQMPKFVDLFAA
jgi:adenine deaminase